MLVVSCNSKQTIDLEPWAICATCQDLGLPGHDMFACFEPLRGPGMTEVVWRHRGCVAAI